MFHSLNTIHDATKTDDGSSYLDTPEEQLPGMPKLKAFWATFKEIAPIKAYLDSELCIPLTDNETGKAPWQPTGYRYMWPLMEASYATPAYPDPA